MGVDRAVALVDDDLGLAALRGRLRFGVIDVARLERTGGPKPAGHGPARDARIHLRRRADDGRFGDGAGNLRKGRKRRRSGVRASAREQHRRGTGTDKACSQHAFVQPGVAPVPAPWLPPPQLDPGASLS